MSASKEKKVRSYERSEGLDKKSAAEQERLRHARKFRRNAIIITVVVVLVIAAAVVINSSLPYTALDAVRIGDTGYSAAEVNYYYNSAFNQYYSNNYYLIQYGMISIDLSSPLNQQSCPYGSDEGYTWADYFYDSAYNTMAYTTAVYDEAMKNGYTLTEDDKANIAEQMSALESSAQEAGLSASKYLSRYVSTGMTTKTFEKLVTRDTIVQSYLTQVRGGFSYTDQELKDYYAENKDELDMYELCVYYVSSSGDAYADMSDEEKTAAVHEAAAAIAQAETPEEFLANVQAYVGEDAQETYAELSSVQSSVQGGSLNSAYKEWAVDAGREAGDTTVADSSSGSYAVLYVSRNDNNYATVNMRHILIQAEADENGEYSDKVLETAKSLAQDVYDEWKEDQTEEHFAQLAEQYSQDPGSNTNGGLYENVPQGYMVEEIDAFCFDSGSKPGDTALVYGETSGYAGYHVVYYAGEGMLYCDYLADSQLREADYDQYLESLVSGYQATEKFGSKFLSR